MIRGTRGIWSRSVVWLDLRQQTSVCLSVNDHTFRFPTSRLFFTNGSPRDSIAFNETKRIPASKECRYPRIGNNRRWSESPFGKRTRNYTWSNARRFEIPRREIVRSFNKRNRETLGYLWYLHFTRCVPHQPR